MLYQYNTIAGSFNRDQDILIVSKIYLQVAINSIERYSETCLRLL